MRIQRLEQKSRKLCIAPMLGWTDRHARFFLRQIHPDALLFTEMLRPEALLYGKKQVFLRHHPCEHPVAFQLGGNQPAVLARAAREVELAGFDEVNLNVGCPSPKGKLEPFGAHLFCQPDLIRDCVQAMAAAVSIPVSVKTRIGIDHDDSYAPLAEFVAKVEPSCRIFYIHARKAWLDGLSPKENRDVPPLRYEYVYRLKREFPHLTIVINGGITEWSQVHRHLEHVDGVMIGRRAYKDPMWLAPPGLRQPEILKRCLCYVSRELEEGTPLREITRHMVGLCKNMRAAGVFRRHLAVPAQRDDAGLEAYLEAIELAEALSRPRERVTA